MNLSPPRGPAGLRLLPALLSAMLLFGAAASHAQVPLALRHTAPILHTAQLVGRTNALKPLSLTLVLPLRNRAMLDAQIKRISDPNDALYGHYLTPEEFAQQFGPDQSDVDAITTFARTHGLTVGEVSPDLTLVHVSGPASTVEGAFGVQINDYVGMDGRAFYAADREPTVSAAVASRLLSVLGLSNAQRPHAFSHPAPPTPLLSFYSGNAGLTPTDVKNIYGLAGTAFTGTGQVAGLFEIGTYTPSDITTYFTTYSVPTTLQVNPVSVDGYDTTSAPGGAAAEITLDVDMFAALSPGLSQIRVYETTDSNTVSFTTLLVDTFTAMAGETVANRPNVISVSYGESEVYEAAADYQALDQATAHLASQGQTVCVSSGDAGAYTDQSAGAKPNASFPADDPYVLCVGGTDLTDGLSGSTVTYVSETSWSDTADKGRGPIGTGGGGGYSAFFPLPSYQTGSFTAAGNPQGSLTRRNVPDVSLYGDYDTGGYDVYFASGGGWGGYNGTSASSPLWAAFLADVNQARAAKSQAAIGFANPAIYQKAESASYATLFHDIADGSNNLFYKAVKGYDNSTGWGTFKGSSLLTALSASAVVPTALSLSPNPVIGGQNVTGTVTLSAAAPTGGALVSVSVNGTTVSSFTITATKTSGTFTLTTSVVTTTTTEMVGASYSGTTVTKVLTLSPMPTTPIITSFSPASGSVGTSVTISGTGFTGASSVKIGGTTATFTVNAATKITAKVATGTATGTITVTTPGGTTTSVTAFTVTASPALTITSFTPTSGPVGTSVTINGTGFTGASSVKIGGTTATFTVNAATKITAKVATGAVTGKIVVTTPSGAATSSGTYTVTATAVTLNAFSYNPNPGFSNGLAQGTVTLSGPAPAGGASVAITNNGSTLATVVIPAGQTTGSYPQLLSTVTASTTFLVAATYSGKTINVSLVVNPTSVTLSGFSLGPNPVASGGTITATVTLSAPAPAGGAAVRITQAGVILGYVPVTAGSTSVTFSRAAPTETAPTTVVYTAAYNGATRTVNETVN